MFLVSAYTCFCATYWSQVFSGEWRCSWSSADRRCSNNIWVISNLIAYKSASYIRDLTVILYENCIWIIIKFTSCKISTCRDMHVPRRFRSYYIICSCTCYCIYLYTAHTVHIYIRLEIKRFLSYLKWHSANNITMKQWCVLYVFLYSHNINSQLK